MSNSNVKSERRIFFYVAEKLYYMSLFYIVAKNDIKTSFFFVKI
jgi:hypothetical protein